MTRKKPAEQAQVVRPHKSGDVLNRSLIGGSLLILIIVFFLGWQALNGGASEADGSSLTPTASPTASADTNVSLKINHTYQREGAEIKTDPSQVGRAGNPLSAPPK